MPPIQIPSGVPQGVRNLIQKDYLSRDLRDGLRPVSMYRKDFQREPLPPHIGETVTRSRLGMFDVDLLPAQPTGDIDYASFESESFTAKPTPYAKGFKIDGPTAYVQVGNWMEQNMKRLAEWGGRTSSRLARGRLCAYFGGRAIVRRAGVISVDTSLYVNSLMGFRKAPVSGTLQDVSASNPLLCTVVAATTFDVNVIGTVPDNPAFPDGPGTLLLSAVLSAAVAGKSYIKASTAPYQIFAGGRESTEGLLVTDKPTLANFTNALARMKDAGLGRHRESGTFHVHADSSLSDALWQDGAWRQAYQGAGISPLYGAGAMLVPALGLTMFDNNDSPASGKGKEVHVGALGTDVNKAMQDIGLDVVNSAGVKIRRALITGDEVGIETYIDESLYFSELGIVPVGKITENIQLYEFDGGAKMMTGEVDGWRLSILPALDPRQLVCTVSISLVADWTLPTDYYSAADASTSTPYRRAVGISYGNEW